METKPHKYTQFQVHTLAVEKDSKSVPKLGYKTAREERVYLGRGFNMFGVGSLKADGPKSQPNPS